jgi:hypothetical protein
MPWAFGSTLWSPSAWRPRVTAFGSAPRAMPLSARTRTAGEFRRCAPVLLVAVGDRHWHHGVVPPPGWLPVGAIADQPGGSSPAARSARRSPPPRRPARWTGTPAPSRRSPGRPSVSSSTSSNHRRMREGASTTTVRTGTRAAQGQQPVAVGAGGRRGSPTCRAGRSRRSRPPRAGGGCAAGTAGARRAGPPRRRRPSASPGPRPAGSASAAGRARPAAGRRACRPAPGGRQQRRHGQRRVGPLGTVVAGR